MSTLMFPSEFSCSSYQEQKGFTLLELVLVMLIIGLVASTPLVFIDNQDNQFRYEQTLDKMELIKRGVLLKSSHRNQPILSGFVIDNGVLPPASISASQNPIELQPLISKDGGWNVDSAEDWADFTVQTPWLLSSIVGSEFEASGYPISKGYRGHYLNAGLDSNQEFRDGWGEGFQVSSDGLEYQFNFHGSDVTQYSSTVSGAFASSDWQVSLGELNLELSNDHPSDHRLAIAVFRNAAISDEKGRWTTYFFSVTTSNVGHSFSSIWSIASGGSISTVPATTEIPAGLHPVFVMNSASSGNSSIVNSDRLLVVPGATQPALQFEVN